MRSRPHPLHPLLATLMLAVWATVPLLPLLHGLHAHHFCEEHQTVEETAPSRDAPDSPAHEECAVSAAELRQLLSPARVFFVIRCPWVPTARPSSSRAGLPQVEPLAVAPKASPPQA